MVIIIGLAVGAVPTSIAQMIEKEGLGGIFLQQDKGIVRLDDCKILPGCHNE
jgi:hypothetical protein